MNKYLLNLFFFVSVLNLKAQSSCSEIMEYVKSNGYGSSYSSYSSDAISQVTFYDIKDESYNTYYFAIVRFTSSSKEYIYQVGSRTKLNYSMDYLDSAGKAFWAYIQPYNETLNCAPEFD